MTLAALRIPVLLACLALLSLATGCSEKSEQADKLISQATELSQNGEPKQAIELIDRALQESPDHVAGLVLRGRLLQQTGNPREASSDLRRAISLSPDSTEPLFLLADLYVTEGDLSAAKQCLDDLLLRNPENHAARLSLAKILIQSDQTEAALDLLALIPRSAATFSEAMILHAELAYRRDPETSVANLTDVLAKDSRNSQAVLQRGFINSFRGRHQEAVSDFRTATELSPSSGEAWHLLGRELLHLHKPEEAETALLQALRKTPNDGTALFHLYQARSSLRDPAAEETLQQCLESDNPPLQALQQAASLQIGRKQFADALALLQGIAPAESAALEPSERIALQLLNARCQKEMGRLSDAMQIVEQLHQQYPDHAEITFSYAEVLSLLRGKEQVAQVLPRLKLNFEIDQGLILRRARLLIQNDLPLLALNDLDQLLRDKQDNAAALMLRAQVRAEMGQRISAISDLTLAISHGADPSEARERRAGLFAESGQLDAAAGDLTELAAEDPHNDEHVRAIVRRWRSLADDGQVASLLIRMNEHPTVRLSSELAVELLQRLAASGEYEQITSQFQHFADAVRRQPEVILCAAVAESKANRHEAAVLLLSELPKDAQTEESSLALTESLMQLGRFEDARISLSELIAEFPDRTEYRLSRIRLLLLEKQWSRLAADADAVLETEPANALARMARGMYLFTQNQYDAALQDLELDAVRSLNHLDSVWARAKSLEQSGRLAQAEAEVNYLLQRNPEHYSARLLAADLSARRGAHIDALRDFAVLLRENSTDYHVLIRRGRLLAEVGRFRDAEEDLTSAISVSGSAEAWYWRGYAMLRQERFEEAANDFDECLQLAPESTAAALGRAAAACFLDDYQRALEIYDRLLAITPDNAEIWFNRGNLLYRAGYQKAAAASWASAVRADMKMEQAWLNLAAVMHELGEDNKSEIAYRQLLKVNPESTVALDRFARLKLYSNDPDCRDVLHAVSLARKATELTEQSDWQLMDTLARAFLAAGERQDALTWATRAKHAAPPALQYQPRAVVLHVQAEIREMQRQQREQARTVSVSSARPL